jgi:putative aldouronate transport system substrate-binding protein
MIAMHPECIYFDLSEREEEVETIAELKSSLAQATLEFSSKYLLVEGMGDQDWKDWLKEAERLEADRLLAVYNAAQARYDAGE